jgi:hypothetical protein
MTGEVNLSVRGGATGALSNSALTGRMGGAGRGGVHEECGHLLPCAAIQTLMSGHPAVTWNCAAAPRIWPDSSRPWAASSTYFLRPHAASPPPLWRNEQFKRNVTPSSSSVTECARLARRAPRPLLVGVINSRRRQVVGERPGTHLTGNIMRGSTSSRPTPGDPARRRLKPEFRHA